MTGCSPRASRAPRHPSRDVEYTWPASARPAFAASTILTLAVAWTQSAVFSVVHGISFSDCPAGERTACEVYEVSPKQEEYSVSGENFLDWRAQSRTWMARAHLN